MPQTTTPTTSVPGFIGLDVETTGLDPHTDLILELGIVLFDANLVPITAESWIAAHWNALCMKGGSMTREVVDMHEESGLFDDVKSHSEGRDIIVAPSLVAKEAIAFLEKHDAVGLPMLGSSVSFDRAFLSRKMPELLDAIHYRSIDASSVRLARLATTPPDLVDDVEAAVAALADSLVLTYRATLRLPRQERRHRAIDDILRSAALADASITAPATLGRQDIYDTRGTEGS